VEIHAITGWEERAGLWHRPAMGPQAAPKYHARGGPAVMMAVECFARHMSSEGWQLQDGLRAAGARLVGYGYDEALTNTPTILEQYAPSVVVVQDQREWDASKPGCFDKQAAFHATEALREHDDVFCVTVIKDAHHDPTYTAANHCRMGVHAWLHYYHPAVISRLAPWLRPEHMIRVHHTVSPDEIPPFVPGKNRDGCLLSGAVAAHWYPLRSRLWHAQLPHTDRWRHPGYHARGHHTPVFLRAMGGYKAAICTTSIFGYALRKIVEAVACGCVPITDLPVADVIPEVDPWLERVPFDISEGAMGDVIKRIIADYDEEYRREGARVALERFDYRTEGRRVMSAIDELRNNYG